MEKRVFNILQMHGYPDMPPPGPDLHPMGDPYVDLPPPGSAADGYAPSGAPFLDPPLDPGSTPPPALDPMVASSAASGASER